MRDVPAPAHRDPQRRVLCDWGSSRLRAFLEVSGSIADRRGGPGIAALGNLSPLDALHVVLEPWIAQGTIDEVLLCGMVGSRNGLVEVPYVSAPLGSDAWAAGSLALARGALLMRVAPGVSALNFTGTPDVMRGEETQIFGALRCRPDLARGRRLLALPGTHSKWVEIQEGRIERFQTYITGELYGLLRNHSSLLRAGELAEPAQTGFESGLGHSNTARLAARLFETRSAQLTLGRSPAWAAGFLSGLLIGDEVADVLSSRTPAGEVALIGAPVLSPLYRQALAAHGVVPTELDGDACAVAGLRLLGTLAGPVPASG